MIGVTKPLAEHGQTAKHASNAVPSRCGDLPVGARGKASFSRVLALVSSSKAPPVPDGMLEPILQEFRKYGPDGGGAFFAQ